MADYIDNLLRALDDKSVQRRIREIAGGDEKKVFLAETRRRERRRQSS